MERGDFKKAAEQGSVEHETTLEAMTSDMVLELMEKVAKNAREGGKWASILRIVDADQGNDLDTARARASDFMQQEGFQTDEAYKKEDDRMYQQLTVFWADGKSIYEHAHLISTFDPELLAQHQEA